MSITINEYLKDWNIIITEMIAADEHSPRKLMGTIKFKTVGQLSGFLSGSWGVAKSIGYNLKRKPRNVNEKRVGRLSFEYSDKFSGDTFEFDNVQEFVKFLENNPHFAKAVEYTPKP